MPFESLEQSNTRRIEILIAQVNILQSQLSDVIQIMGIEVSNPTPIVITCPKCTKIARKYFLDKNTQKYVVMSGIGMSMDNAELIAKKYIYINCDCGEKIEYIWTP
jgi:hypothetical protein